MRILSLDTSASMMGVAIAEQGKILAEVHIADGRAEDLVSLIDSLFSLSRIEKPHADGIALVAGPGSYTGLRSSFTVAKTLAGIWGCPVVTLGTCEFLTLSIPTGAWGAVILSASKGQKWLSILRWRDDLIDYHLQPVLLNADEIVTHLQDFDPSEPYYLLGDGSEMPFVRLGVRIQLPGAIAPTGLLAMWGERAIARGGAVDLLTLEPTYGQTPVYRKLTDPA